jgi:hypothetical protein
LLTHYLQEHGYEVFKLATSEKELIEDPIQLVTRADEHELMADKNAIQLLRNAGYDAREGIKALEAIDFDPKHRLDIVKMLSTPEVRIDEKELCTPVVIEQQYKQRKNFVFANGKRPIDLNTRTRALRALYQPTDTSGSKFCFGKGEFDTIRMIANMELIHNSVLRNDYIRGAHAALIKLQTEPKHRFAVFSAAQSLQSIGAYAKTGSLSNILFDKGLLKETDLAGFYCYMNTLPPANLQQIVFRYIEKMYNGYADDETMIIVMAQASENYLGLEAAQKYYLKYIDLFPKGNKISLAQLKTTRQ